MTQDYPLEDLSPRAFEQMIVALSLKVLGNGVSAFGAGPDGGREATYRGPVLWSATTGFGDDSWDGYVVVQAKQREHPASPSDNLKWLRDQIGREFDNWTSDASQRGEFPQYLIFVTNVRLSSVASSGGIDQINAYISSRLTAPIGRDPRDSLASRGLTAVKVWHRDQVNALLTTQDSVRNAFKGLLTVGDLLSRIAALGGLLDPSKFAPVLKAHAITTLGSERWVNFSEAGGENRQSVDNVVIDLKASGTRDSKLTLLEEVIERGDQVLKRSFVSGPRHIVLTGQPGSGKSTITMFLSQLYRANFVTDEAQTATSEAVRVGTEAALARLGLKGPSNRRWPIRITLPRYADALGPDGDKTLLRWISERVTERAEFNILPNTLKRWLQHWPCLVILDGLDEVTSPEVRPRVLDEIQAFVEMADLDDADLLVIITTRPLGYTEQIMPDHFSQLNLTYLDAQTAIDYGRHITSRRLADDLDRRDQLIARFEREAADPAMLRLMKTPLQVLIMTFILEVLGTLPADRYRLFRKYFDTVYQREQAKNTTLAPLLSAFQHVIVALHEAVGLALQIQSETSTDARAVLPRTELRKLAMERLIAVGHEYGPGIERIATQIVQAATERLVLLVPAENDGVSFEIRSLQELMAARALSNATDDETRARLTITAPSPHWRYTWIFAAGRLFAEGPDHRRDLVLEVIEQIDRSPEWIGWLSPVAAELGAALLDDGMAITTPKWQRRLLDATLGSLAGPMPLNVGTVAQGLSAAAAQGSLGTIRTALRTALGGTPVQREIAAALEEAGKFGQPIQPEWKSSLTPTLETVVTRQPLADLIAPALDDLGLGTDPRAAIDAMLAELRGFRITDEWDPRISHLLGILPAQLPDTLAALADADAAAGLELVLESLGPAHWTAGASLAQLVAPSLSRSPVGPRLAMQGDMTG